MFLGSLHLLFAFIPSYSPVKFLVLFFLFKDLFKKHFRGLVGYFLTTTN